VVVVVGLLVVVLGGIGAAVYYLQMGGIASPTVASVAENPRMTPAPPVPPKAPLPTPPPPPPPPIQPPMTIPKGPAAVDKRTRLIGTWDEFPASLGAVWIEFKADGQYRGRIQLGPIGADVNAVWRFVREDENALIISLTGQLAPNQPEQTHELRLTFMGEDGLKIDQIQPPAIPRMFKKRFQAAPVTPDPPPPSGPLNQTLIGTWDAQPGDNVGPGDKVSITFRADGTMSGSASFKAPPRDVEFSGTWKVVRQDQLAITVEMALKDPTGRGVGLNSQLAIQFRGEDRFWAAPIVAAGRNTFVRRK
jgi:hypothetical protein